MSTHYSSNQFNSAFVPCRLQNFELPSKYKEFPSQRKGCTQPIANDRGHIVIHDRKSSTSPWGHFLGTWQKPRKPIKLRVTTKLMARGYNGGDTPVACPHTTSGTPISASNNQVEESFSQSPASPPFSNGPLVEASKSPKGSRSGSPSSPPPGTSNHSTPSSSRCTSAYTNRSSTCTPEKNSKQRISSAGHTPYSRQTLISPSSESNGSRPPSSSHSSVRSTPKPSVSPSERKPSSSGSSRAISSAPVTIRSSGSQQSDRQSLMGSSQSQRTCSQNCSRPESRQGTGQQSVMSQDDRTTYPSSYIESRPPSSQVSRPPSQASIALTSSTKSGLKSRGVQCT